MLLSASTWILRAAFRPRRAKEAKECFGALYGCRVWSRIFETRFCGPFADLAHLDVEYRPSRTSKDVKTRHHPVVIFRSTRLFAAGFGDRNFYAGAFHSRAGTGRNPSASRTGRPGEVSRTTVGWGPSTGCRPTFCSGPSQFICRKRLQRRRIKIP